jgi:hypothetical protein
MVAQVFKRFFQISFVVGCVVAAVARLNGWHPTISAIENLSENSPLFCLFHYFTGWDCPGCGLTRAVLSFFAGDLRLSFYFHPLGPLMGLFICYLFALSLRKKHLWSPQKWLKSRWSWNLLLILIAWGFLRN